MRQAGPSAEELQLVRRSLSNSFIFGSDSSEKIVSRRAQLQLYGYPEDYDKNYLKNIFAVTAEDVRDVANKRWPNENFVVIVVGNAEAYKSLKAAVDSGSDLLGYKSIKKLKFDEKVIF